MTLSGSPVDFPTAFLGTTTLDQFLANSWRRRFLHVPGGAAGLLPLLPTIGEVEAILGAPAHPAATMCPVIVFPVGGIPVAREWLFPIDPPRQRDPGEPANLTSAERWFPGLYPIGAELERVFRAPASLQVFWGPPGGGLRPHRDINDSFVIQIHGAKRWHVADLEDGRPQHSGIGGGELGDHPRVFDLRPGDVLYKPSHAVHATESSDEPTLSITCSIATRTAADAVLEVLRDRMDADPAWLERLPLLTGPEGSDDDVARTRIGDILDRLPDILPSLADLEDRARR